MYVSVRKKQVIKKLSPKSLWQTYIKWTVAIECGVKSYFIGWDVFMEAGIWEVQPQIVEASVVKAGHAVTGTLSSPATENKQADCSIPGTVLVLNKLKK